MKIEHRPECTWLLYVKAGEIPPGQSFGGELSYIWCHAFCERPIDQIDFGMIYEAAHTKEHSSHRVEFDLLVARAVKEKSTKLKNQALRMANTKEVNYI